MNSTDPRHATYAGYVAGCRDDCCRTAARNYQKRRRIDRERGNPRAMDPVGVHRRVQALACLGWTGVDIARPLGHDREWLRQVLNAATVYRTTHEAIAGIYDRLSMRLPPAETAGQRMNITRTQNRARRNGWVPPLGWDDDSIDDPDAQPLCGVRDDEVTVDPIVVQRVLDGDWRLRANHAERLQVIDAWTTSGRTLAELDRRTGWNVHRDLRDLPSRHEGEPAA